MEIALCLAGAALLVMTGVDVLWTTLWTDSSAGPVSSRLISVGWRVSLRAAGGRHRLLSVFGPLALISTVLLWTTLLWAGWYLVFSADEASVLRSTSGAPAHALERIYFVGYTVFTLGNGDYRPGAGVWQFATPITALGGLLLITLAVSYLLAVLSAVVQKRAFAMHFHGLGDQATDVVTNSWGGGSLAGLELMLPSIGADLSLVSARHLAYPILHYYHSDGAAASASRAIATLDDTVTLVGEGVAPDLRPSPAVLRSMRASVDGYLATLESGFGLAEADVPPPPPLDELRSAGIATVAQEDFDRALAALADRRRRLYAAVRSDGWEWPG